jgi:hypothetical protein
VPSQRSEEDLFWNDEAANGVALGCGTCPDLAECGGLSVKAPVIDCTAYCKCEDINACNALCRRNAPRFVRLHREVDGFDFRSVPDTPNLPDVRLPATVPVVYHGKRRDKPFEGPAVAIPLFAILDRRTQRARFQSKAALAEHFGFLPTATVVATATDFDSSLERWWSADGAMCAESLIELGVALVTTPNFSLFNDVPRQDNLHNMKRIAMSFAMLTGAGLATALHLNARTEHDYRRWGEFIAERKAVRALAVEFATGAGYRKRLPWHVLQLCRLSERIGRPMQMLVRGGEGYLAQLAQHFTVAHLDTSAFIKTHKRRRAEQAAQGVRWVRSPTLPGQSLHEIFAHNVAVISDRARTADQRQLHEDVDDEPLQVRSLGHLNEPLAAALAANEDCLAASDTQAAFNF